MKQPQQIYHFEVETGTITKYGEYAALRYVKDCFYRRKACTITKDSIIVGWVSVVEDRCRWRFEDGSGCNRAVIQAEYEVLKRNLLKLKKDQSLQINKHAASIRKYIREWGLKDKYTVDASVVLKDGELLHGCTVERIK